LRAAVSQVQGTATSVNYEGDARCSAWSIPRALPTQRRACEEYCRRQGYEVLERFSEEGESAKTADRTELQNLLKYCRTHKGKVHFVVVYNLTRVARVRSTTTLRSGHI
jgi:DNA invertase Pin-like site-specific DNA recombinase